MRQACNRFSCFVYIWRSGQLPGSQTAKARKGCRVQSLRKGRDRQCKAQLINTRLPGMVTMTHLMDAGTGSPPVCFWRQATTNPSLDGRSSATKEGKGRPKAASFGFMEKGRERAPLLLRLFLLAGSWPDGGCVLLDLGCEPVAVPEILIERASHLRGAGAKGRPSAFQKEDRHQTALRRVGPRSEPAEAGAICRAGSRLAKHRQLVEVGLQPAGGAILHRSRHAVLQLGNVAGDVQRTLDLWFKAGGLFRSGRMLQVVKRSAVGQRGHKGTQLQRSQ